MKRDFYLLSIFVLLVSLTSAQDYKISGIVLDTEGKALVYANVVLESKDGNPIKGTATDENGQFLLEGIVSGDYRLYASYIKSSSEVRALSVKSDTDVGNLLINQNTQELEEVVVTYEKPTLVQKADRYVFNIENSALADSDIWDVLKNTPGVVIVNDKITVQNTGNISVLINGRRVNIPESDIINLLSGSSASNVEAIEVITNPPAKYSAEGGLLIDIKMKKNIIAGYNGSIYNRYSQGVFPKHTLGTDHFFKGKRTDFSVNYSFRKNKNLRRYTDITNFFEGNNVDETWQAEQQNISRTEQHNVNLFFDYRPNDKNTLSFSSINSLRPFGDTFLNSETQITNIQGQPNASFNTINNSDANYYNTSYYLDWKHEIDEDGQELAFNTHYTFYNYARDQDIVTDFFDNDRNLTGENDFVTQSDQRTNLFSLQLDYTKPLGKTITFETGLRYATIQSDNAIEQIGFDSSQPGINPTEIGNFVYDERISAGYLSMDHSLEQWKLKAGLRTEYTETVGDLDAGTNRTKNSYLEFFPSFSALYTPNKKNSFKLNYYRRITRPRYDWLNPFQYFQSNNTTVEGNPDLIPSTRNSISLAYTYDKTYTFTAFYYRRKNEFLQQVFQDNEANLLRFIATNLDSNRNYGADIVFNKKLTSYWSSYALLSYFNRENTFSDFDTGELFVNSIWSGLLRLRNSFTLLEDKSLFADVNYSYYAPTFQGNARQDEVSTLGLAFRKTLWDKNASVSLAVEDIFNGGNYFYTRRFANQNNTTSSRRETRLFVFGFRYKFGNTRIKDNYKRKRVDERSRI
jgi:outer membrane receptor protein involved in Fe transport